MPGASESSTVEWQSAHWMPTERRLPAGVEEARDADDGVEPAAAPASSAGSSRSTVPCLSCLHERARQRVHVHLEAERRARFAG